MPTTGTDWHPVNRDPQRWCACMRQAEAELLAKGIRNSHRRWHDMRRTKALKLFNPKG